MANLSGLDWTVWLRAQRQRAIDILLMIVLALSSLGMLVSTWSLLSRSPGARFPSNFPIYAIAYILVWIIFLTRRLGESWRAIAFLALLYAFSVWSLSAGWLASSGRVFLLSMVVAAVVLSSLRSSLVAALLSLVTFVGMGLAFWLGWIPLRPLPEPNTLQPILIEGVGFALAVGIVSVSQWFFTQALIAANRATAEASQARQLLDERAQQLEAANALIARRAEALSAAATVARDVTSLRNLPELLEDITKFISERFNFYSASVFLLEPENRFAVLRAVSSAQSEPLLKPGYQIDLAGPGVVAMAARTGERCLLNDVRNSQQYLPCDYLPETCSELALPLRARGRVIGVLDAQCAQPDRFTSEDELQVLMLLADQVALALDNALLFETLRQRTVQVEAANRELESFSYSVSHDLRAPLRSIDGYCALALDTCGQDLSPECRNFMLQVREGVNQMSELIDGLLRLSRLTRMDMQIQEVDLSAMAGQEAAVLMQADPGRTIEFDIAPGLKVRGDPAMLRAVIQNLFENAWKFTRSRQAARIELGVLQVEGGRGYFVRDNGIGFDQQYAERIFGAFQRLQRVEDYPGAGIGLATVRRIIQRHGGRIWAESAPGEGATFCFTLPEKGFSSNMPD